MHLAHHHPAPARIAEAMLRHQAGLALGDRINPARRTTPATEAIRELPNVTQLLDFCEDAPSWVYQRDFQGREPFLLRPDAQDPFSFIPLPIHDKRALPAACGRFWIELETGSALLPGDTLVYWRYGEAASPAHMALCGAVVAEASALPRPCRAGQRRGSRRSPLPGRGYGALDSWWWLLRLRRYPHGAHSPAPVER